nr:MAG TPA: PolyVal ADP-Ribosyltransferase [Caudoviricetes sp.]
MMPTTREFLGDSLIKELEGAGFSPQSINAFAKNEYRQRKAAQEEEQRRLLYRADDMKLDGKVREALLSGDINEQEAKNAQKFEEVGAKKHGWTLGAAKTVTGIANTIERVGDFINPFYEGKRDKDGNYIYQNGLENSLRSKIKNVEKMRDDYEKATGETSWGSRLSEIGTELVGDPINFVGGVGLLSKGSKLAQFGKKTLYFAGTGAASGGVAALGEGKNDKETLENIGYGAVGGAFLGHAIDQGIQGISKLIAKRQASKMANEADAIESAENSEFLNGGNSASKDVSSGNGSLEYPNTQSIAVTIVRGVLKNEPLSTREQVLKEILSGEEKSSVIKPEKYKSILTGINEYKSYQNRLKHFHDNPNEVKNADLVFDQMQDDFMKANGGNTKKYYDAAPLFGRELKTAETMSAKEFATKEVGLDEDTATNVLKEAMQGKEKSEFIDADSYNDIVKFKNFEVQREYAKAYGERIQTAQTSINNAREQSAIRYADTQKAINEYQKQGMSPSAIRELINAKFKPSADEIDYTRAYNDGADVDARLAGQGIFYALEKDIAAYFYTPEQYFARLKSKGYGDEQATEFTRTYVQKDINIAKEYVNEKVADAYESRVQREVADEINSENRININKDGAYSGHPMLRPDESSIGQGDLKGNLINEETKNSALPNGVSGIGDNASGAGGRQGGDEEILRQSGRNTADASEEKWTAKSDRQMEQRPAFKGDGKSDAAASSKQMVEKQGRDDNEIRGDGFVLGDSGKAKQYATQKFNIEKWVNDLSGVLSDEWVANLKSLALKHPEMFKSESDVFKVIREIKNEPTHFLKNTRDDVALIAKRLGGGKVGNIGVKKDNGQIIHANKTDERDLTRLLKRGKKGELTRTPALETSLNKEDGELLKLSDEGIIPQKEINAKTINANSHIASGLVGGMLNSIDEDGSFNPEKFATGFLAGLAGSKAVAIAARKMTPQLYNKILGVAKKMPQMAKDNPKLLGKLYQNAKDASLNSFAGEKAITANVGKLDQAKAMLEKGADEVEIWQKTGWFKDKDEAWKFEIGDSKARLNPNFKSGGKLGELLEHEELFKAYPELKDISVKKIGDDIPDGAALSVKNTAQKEKRGIYNVAYNDKSATLVRRDLEKIDDALMFEKGSSKKGGAIHIKKHLEPEAQGAITQSELLNIGKNIREYLQKYKEPFIDEHGGRIYEWPNKEGVKFRVVVYEKTDGISASHPETIISFYSNRNLKKPMEFRNPEVKYDVNLRQWHKDSAPITKNADGSPKVFYHGSKARDIAEFKDEFDKSGYGFWFNQSKSTAVEFKQDGKIYQVYLNVKNPIDLSFPYSQKAKNLLDEAEKLGIDTELYPESQSGAFKKFLEQKGYDGIVMDDLDGAAKYPHVIVFHSNQIKHVKNNGNFSDSPNIYKSGKEGYYSPAKNEIGLSDLGDKSTLMHEVQHAIQEIEDFSRGSGAKGESYRLSHGEAEARNVQNRLNLGDKFRAKIVKDNNPVGDDYHAWIRGENDIKTFKQAYDDDGGGDLAPDFTEAMAKKAIDSGEITVYSSRPIKAGSFVTPSKMEAKSYAGSGEIYEEKLNLNDVSWLDALQGQVTRNKDIHPYETFDVNPNETIVSKDGMINLSHELEKKYILKDGSINEAAVRKEAEPFIEKEYSLENFKAEFPNGKVDTPVGEVDVSVSQFYKLGHKGRDEYFGLIKPTLERPAFVVDFEDSTFFFKPFRDKDGVVKFASVIKERDSGLDVVSNYPMKNRKFELITREGKIRYVQGSVVIRPLEHSLDNTVQGSVAKSPIEHSLDGEGIIPQNEEKIYHSRKIEEIKQEHPNVEKELDESIAAMRKESFNDVNFKDDLISKINAKEITTKQLGKSVDLSDKQLAVLKNDIKNADFKVISDSKIYFDKMGRDGDKKRFFIDIAEDGKVRVDGYSKKGIDTIPVRQSALEELAGVGDRARLKNMSFEVKAAYFNELDPIKKEAILKTAELNKLKKAAQSGDKMAMAKFEDFRARNLDENGNIKDGLSLC